MPLDNVLVRAPGSYGAFLGHLMDGTPPLRGRITESVEVLVSGGLPDEGGKNVVVVNMMGVGEKAHRMSDVAWRKEGLSADEARALGQRVLENPGLVFTELERSH